jgi:orotidine-5'-phosphate decarboxylase
MTFYKRLEAAWAINNSLLCIGIDPQPQQVQSKFTESAQPYLDYCLWLIEQTHHYVCGYKFQVAYFSSQCEEAALEAAIQHVKNHYPELLVILDAKRGDIADTAEHYALEAFERYQADAVTLNPYLGQDSAQPFLNHTNKGSVFLCKTSNAGAQDFQELPIAQEPPKPLYAYIADVVSQQWNKDNCMLVMGATWPDAMKIVRESNPSIPFLVPGIGKQGGDLEQVIKAGLTEGGTGLIVCASRSIAQSENPRLSAQKLANQISGIVLDQKGEAE